MELNEIIFPAPKPSYNSSTITTMVWIPRAKTSSKKPFADPPEGGNYQQQSLFCANQEKHSLKTLFGKEISSQVNHYQEAIPCNYHQPKEESDIILIFFHGNAEDIGMSVNFTRELSEELKMNILSVEYPGYGVYKGTPNAKIILEDAETVFNFLVEEAGINPQKIYLFGRSIGSGPATYLAANRNPGMLILMSAYTSIRDIVKSKVGSFAQFLVAERFRNIDQIQRVSCSSFFIHGNKDTLIPSSHTMELFSKCKAFSGVSIRMNMTHSKFNMKKDIIAPVLGFLSQVVHKNNTAIIKFPTVPAKQPIEDEEKENDDDYKAEARTQRAHVSPIKPNHLLDIDCKKGEDHERVLRSPK